MSPEEYEAYKTPHGAHEWQERQREREAASEHDRIKAAVAEALDERERRRA
jgi:hypothetical protein